MEAPRTIVFGSDRLGQRIAEQLRRDDCGVVVVALQDTHLAGTDSPPDLTVARAAADDLETMKAAGVAEAQLVLAVTDNDELNLAIALASREVNPRVRLVLRQFNVRLGSLLSQHLPDTVILSLSALTAPTFAAAALVPGVVFAHLAGRSTLVLRERRAAESASSRSTVLGVATAEGVRWFPAGEPGPEARVLEAACLGDVSRHAPRLPRPEAPASRGPAWRGPDRLLLLTLLALVALVAGGALLFHLRLGLSPMDAFYFVSTIVTTVGFGDFSLRDADAVTKVAGIATMFMGLGLSAILVALLTNELVAHRAQIVRGRFRWRLRDHVVVCGLGTIGLRIALVLREMGEEVVMIEADHEGRFVPAARAAGIKLVVGDAAQEESLLFANVGRARALVAVTSSDYRNLEIALSARSLAPDLPLVLRMFDPDSSRRVATAFGIQGTFSGATLGAGRFTAFAADGTRVASLHFAGEPYALHEVPGRPGDTVDECARRLRGTALAVIDAAGTVDLVSIRERSLGAGESVLVVVHAGALD